MDQVAHQLREAEDAGRAEGRAAAQAMLQVLRERDALYRGVDRWIVELIDQAMKDILATLASAPSDYQLWSLPQLMQGIRAVAQQLGTDVAARADVALQAAWALGERVIEQPLQAAAAANASLQAGAAGVAAPGTLPLLQAPDLRALRAMQAFNTEKIRDASAELVRRINASLGQVVLGVRAPIDAIREVRTALPERTAAQVRGIVTTNLGAAYGSASYRTLLERAARDPSLKKQWRRSGKVESRWNHDLADGQVQEVAKPFEVVDGHKKGAVVHLQFPGDPQAPIGETIHCGCVMLPWKSTWKMLQPGAKPFSDLERKARQDAQTRRRAGLKRPAA